MRIRHNHKRAIKSACGKKSVKSSYKRRTVKASATGKIPYDLVSPLVILRDWAEVGSDDYINSEHEQLVGIADFLYNADLPADNLKPEAKAVYDKYGKSYFNKVLKDISAIDSQISRSNVDDLIAEYEDKAAEFKGINATTKRRPIKASKNRRRTPIMAGAGAGYTIEWELERIGAVNSFTVSDVSKVDKYGNVTIKADCDVDLVVTIKSALSYMYGMTTPIENVSAKMYRVELDLNIYDDYTIVDNAGNEKLLLNPDDYEGGVDDPAFIAEVDNALYQINEMQASTLLEYDTNWQDGGGYSYGGGYSHSTWDGTILSDDEYHYAFIQVTDESVIEYVDKAVQGENIYSTYEVFVDGDATGYAYDTEEEAIAEAKEYIESGNYEGDIANTYVERQDWFEFYDGDADLENAEIVWNAFDEYENY